MKKSTFIEGTFIATLAIVITKIIGMLYVIPFYSIIGQNGSTLYSYAYNIYQIFLSISAAGIPVAMSKIVSEFDSQDMKEAKIRSFKIGIAIVMALSIVCFLILMFFSENIALWVVGNKVGGNSIEDITLVIFVISFAVLIIPFLSVGRGFLQGHKIIGPSSFSQMLEQIVRIIVILVGSYISIKVLNKSVTIGVAIAVSGAFWGGLVSIIYIFKKILNNKNELNIGEKLKKDKISNKEILKKFLVYAIPFVIINVTVNIYNTVDMSLIIRTLSKIGYTGANAEYVASAVTTWGYKLNQIVTAIATGLTISLIPNIVSAYTKKEYITLNSIINKSLQIILFVSLPAAIGLSFLAEPVWNVFYGLNNTLGPTVFKLSILTAIFCNVYLVCVQTAQSLNRFKCVYVAVFAGFITNALLDVPYMLICSKIGIPPFYGATIATMTGYVISILIITINLKKIEGVDYSKTYQIFGKLVVAIITMLATLSLLKFILPFNNSTRLLSCLYVALYAVVGGIVYLFVTYKMKIIDLLFGKNYKEKIANIISKVYLKNKRDIENEDRKN